MEELKQIILKHVSKYPLMEVTDVIKLVYQNEFGGGHMIKDPETSLNYLIRECNEIKCNSDVEYEDIGNNLIRYNLSFLNNDKSKIKELNERFNEYGKLAPKSKADLAFTTPQVISALFTLYLAFSIVIPFAVPEILSKEKYLDESLNLINNVWMECGANWYQNAINGGEFYQSSLPRWESLHPLMALSELYIATKDQEYLTIMGQVWESIREHDIHNAGSFTSNETATGDPYADNNIETCCTIAWMEYSIEYMQLVENSLIADYMELAQFNAVYGSQLQLDEKQGNIQYYTYDTPMNGSKIGAVKGLVWQSIGRAADVSCCQLNGPKGPSLIGQWGFYKANAS